MHPMRLSHPPRRAAVFLLLLLITTMTTLGLSACGSTAAKNDGRNAIDARKAESPQYRDGTFHNPVEPKTIGWRETPRMLWRFMFDKPAEAVPAAPLPVAQLSRAQLLAAPDRSLVRLGHSTVLLKLDGAFWLTDPVFSERASPVQWAGPKRFHAPPIAIDDLPSIQGVVLSHDHFDHLDKAAVLQLADRVQWFVAPLGVGDLLIEWGVDPAKVRQLDWWQSTTVEGIRLVATPAQHFSGRSLFGRNATLWASWVIQSGDFKVFFSGDTGYFDGFKAIGEKHGPFDVTMIECGAYDRQWSGVHMQPEETLQAHLDLRGKRLMPVHNGTFDLALHDWHDPFTRIAALASAREVPLLTPRIGEPLDLQATTATAAWWTKPAELAHAD